MTKELPILMHGRSVRGILEARKHQTRRPIKNVPDDAEGFLVGTECEGDKRAYAIPVDAEGRTLGDPRTCPFGDIGYHLWVRETWRPSHGFFGWGVQYRADGKGRQVEKQEHIKYLKDKAERTGIIEPGPHSKAKGETGKWAPSIHMPQWASRLTLRVVDVRVERVQNISDKDVIAEGVEYPPPGGWEHRLDVTPQMVFKELWDDTNSHRLDEYGWDADPWVWCISFNVLEPKRAAWAKVDRASRHYANLPKETNQP